MYINCNYTFNINIKLIYYLNDLPVFFFYYIVNVLCVYFICYSFNIHIIEQTPDSLTSIFFCLLFLSSSLTSLSSEECDLPSEPWILNSFLPDGDEGMHFGSAFDLK